MSSLWPIALLAVLTGCPGKNSTPERPDLTGALTLEATDGTRNIHINGDLPPAHVVIVGSQRMRVIQRVSAKEGGKVTTIGFNRTDGAPAPITHVMLIATHGAGPTMSELNELVPDPILADGATDEEVLEELKRLASVLEDRHAECAVLVEAFPGG